MAIKNTSSLRPTIRPALNLDFANSKVLDPRITFSRESTATYWDGKTTTLAEENLIKSSNYPYYYNRLTVYSESVLAPDGTTTAHSALETLDNDTHDTYKTASGIQEFVAIPSGTVSTASVYVKDNGRNFVSLSMAYDSNRFVTVAFDLVNSTSGTAYSSSGTYITSSIKWIGNGWHRISLTASINGYPMRYILLAGATSSNPATSHYGREQYAGDVSKGFYFWQWQLEFDNKLTYLTKTTGYAVRRYQPVMQTAPTNEPRFNHDPSTGESNGLLMEGSITNLITNSADFCSLRFNDARNFANYGIAPDGTQSARLCIQDSSTSGYSYNSFSNVIGDNKTYTMSVYFKHAYGTGSFRFSLGGVVSASMAMAVDNIESFSASVSNAGTYIGSSIQYIANGWYRGSVTFTATSAPGYEEFACDPQGTYSGWFIWGLQLEQGIFMSSYIPTSGAQVTRSSDSVQIEYSNAQSITGGYPSIYIDADTFGPTNNSNYRETLLTLYYDSSNWIDVGLTSFGSINSINSFMYSEGIQNIAETVPFPIELQGSADPNGKPYKVAFALGDSSYSLAVTGTNTVGTDANYLMPKLTEGRIYLGSRYQSSQYMNGHIKKFAYYPQKLSNEVLLALTED